MFKNPKNDPLTIEELMDTPPGRDSIASIRNSLAEQGAEVSMGYVREHVTNSIQQVITTLREATGCVASDRELLNILTFMRTFGVGTGSLCGPNARANSALADMVKESTRHDHDEEFGILPDDLAGD